MRTNDLRQEHRIQPFHCLLLCGAVLSLSRSGRSEREAEEGNQGKAFHSDKGVRGECGFVVVRTGRGTGRGGRPTLDASPDRPADVGSGVTHRQECVNVVWTTR